MANQLLALNGLPVSYDANGNLLDDGQHTYAYDDLDRLAQVTQGITTTTFGYTGDGDRLWQASAGLTTTFTLDLNTALTQVLAQQGGGHTTRFLPGSGQQVDGAWQYLHADALGSVRLLSDAHGQLLGSLRYSPFGEVEEQSGSRSPLGFTGQMQDAASGLTYLRARSYDPALGRFLTPDAIVPNATNGQAWNAYAYAYNDGVNLVDPSGFDPGPCNYAPLPGCGSGTTGVRDMLSDFGNKVGQKVQQIGNDISKWWNKRTCPCSKHYSDSFRDNVSLGGSIAGASYLGVATTAAEPTGKLIIEQRKVYFGILSSDWKQAGATIQGSYQQVSKILSEGGEYSASRAIGRFSRLETRMQSMRGIRAGPGALGIAGSLLGGALVDAVTQFLWNDAERCLSGKERLWNAGMAALAGLGAAAFGALVTGVVLAALPVGAVATATAIVVGGAAGVLADTVGPIADAREGALIKR